MPCRADRIKTNKAVLEGTFCRGFPAADPSGASYDKVRRMDTPRGQRLTAFLKGKRKQMLRFGFIWKPYIDSSISASQRKIGSMRRQRSSASGACSSTVWSSSSTSLARANRLRTKGIGSYIPDFQSPLLVFC